MQYMDAWVPDLHGRAQLIKQAICIHEEDAGLLWKHTDAEAGIVETRRARRLVMSFISTGAKKKEAVAAGCVFLFG